LQLEVISVEIITAVESIDIETMTVYLEGLFFTGS
jgi:hypothetical protein